MNIPSLRADLGLYDNFDKYQKYFDGSLWNLLGNARFPGPFDTNSFSPIGIPCNSASLKICLSEAQNIELLCDYENWPNCENDVRLAYERCRPLACATDQLCTRDIFDQSEICCPEGRTACRGGCISACPPGQGIHPFTCACQCIAKCPWPLIQDSYTCECKCSNSCPVGFLQDQTDCSCSCPAGSTACGKKCVNLQVDRHNCGECGKSCAPNENCCNGWCNPMTTVDACGSCTTQCSHVSDFKQGCCALPGSSRRACTVLVSDQHCGDCNTRCTNGFTCVINSDQTDEDGYPVTSCGCDIKSGKTICGDGTCCNLREGQQCVNGVCQCRDGSRPCSNGICCDSSKGMICLNGKCQCSGGTVSCYGNCCDTSKGKACINGRCQCPANSIDCNGSCCDTAAGKQCINGSCQCPPDAKDCNGNCCGGSGGLNKLDCCDGVCKQLNTDQNCSACGDRCGMGEKCCNGRCTRLGTDNNCSDCGNNCNRTDWANVNTGTYVTSTSAECQNKRCVCKANSLPCGDSCCPPGYICIFNGYCSPCPVGTQPGIVWGPGNQACCSQIGYVNNQPVCIG